MRETSLIAYEQIKAEGLLSPMRFRAYEYLALHGVHTAAEIDQAFDSRHMNKRMSELEELKVVHTPRVRACRVTGREALEWAVIPEALPFGTVLPKAPKAPTPEECRLVLHDLRIIAKHADQQGYTFQHLEALTKLGDWLKHRASKTKG